MILARKDQNIPVEMEDVLKQGKNRELVQGIEELRRNTSTSLFGSQQGFSDDNKANLEKTKDAINLVISKYKEGTGQGILEFFTQLALSDKNPYGSRLNGTTIKPRLKSGQKQDVKAAMKRLMEDPNNAAVQDIFFNEKNRINGYNDYDLICDYIPQLAQALDTYVDSIVSPDDFTKISLNYYYKDQLYTEEKNMTVKNNIRNIIETYKFDEVATERIVKETLKYGDCFVLALPYKDEFERFLNESHSFDSKSLIPDQTSFLLTESTIDIKNEEYNDIRKALNLSEDVKDNTIKEDLMRCLNENIEICDSKVFMEEVFTTTEDFKKNNKKFKKEFADKDGSLLISGDELETSSVVLGTELHKRMKQQYDKAAENNSKTTVRNRKGGKVKVGGSYFKILDPRRVVKINVGPTIFGYFYIDKGATVDYNPSAITKNVFSNSVITNNGIPSAGAIDIQVNNGDVDQTFNMDAKMRVINDLFCRNISVMLDKKFIEKNHEFKNLMYELLKNEYILKKRVRVIFITPEEMEHFKIGGDDDYGESIFKKILFTAKMYLAVLTTQLMMKITRSSDHRAFYIETGLSEDVEQTIQGFIRDIKAKEVKLKDMNSIDTIFNSIGQFIDYFIPVVNGDKSVDIDTIAGMNVDMDNDFLDYLRKSMISGMGIPSNYLNYNDEVEFAKSLSMVNSKYIRKIIMYQVPMGKSFTRLFRILYKNEYALKLKASEVVEFENILRNIEIRFPSPGSLNMTNLTEQVQNAQQMAEYITNTILGQNFDSSSEDAGAIKDKATLAVTKDLLPTIDWNKYEKLIEESKSEFTETRLENSDNAEDQAEMMENEEDYSDEENDDEFSEEDNGEVESESSEDEDELDTENPDELENDADTEDTEEEPSEEEENSEDEDIDEDL